MRYAWSIRYLKTVDALKIQTSKAYELYLSLGLECPEKGCSARVFFTKGHERKSHRRHYKSGKVVAVKSSQPDPHFTCFDAADCAGLCQKRLGDLPRWEIERLDTIGRNQRRKKLEIHFLQMYDFGREDCLNLTDDHFVSRLLQLGLSQAVIFSTIELACQGFLNSKYNVLFLSNRYIDQLTSMSSSELVNFSSSLGVDRWKDYADSLSTWLKDLEVDLHKLLVKEAFEFLGQKRSYELLKSVMFRNLLGYALYLQIRNRSFPPVVEAASMLLQIFTTMISGTRWAENWSKLEKEGVLCED